MRGILCGLASVAVAADAGAGQESQIGSAIEQKIASQVSQIIQKYDFSQVIEESVQEELARQANERKATVQGLLKQLQEALKDQDQIAELFPDARLQDREMFTHMDMNFDLTNNLVRLQTAAKDYHGQPHYQYNYNTDYRTAIEVSNIGDEATGITTTQTEMQVPVDAADTELIQGITAQAVNIAGQIETPEPALLGKENLADSAAPGQEAVDRVLTPEEQREVAFKVVAFFIMLIFASFGILYIYHRCSQSGIKSVREKKTFLEFLAGELDDTRPSAHLKEQIAREEQQNYDHRVACLV